MLLPASRLLDSLRERGESNLQGSLMHQSRKSLRSGHSRNHLLRKRLRANREVRSLLSWWQIYELL